MMRKHLRLAILLPMLLSACASLQAVNPATMDCPALSQALAQSTRQLQDERISRRSPIQINLGIGGAIGSHGSAGIGVDIPVGTPVVDSARIAELEQRIALLKSHQQQRQCPSSIKP